MCEQCGRHVPHVFVPSRRGLLLGASAMLIGGVARAKEASKPPKPQNAVSPEAALERLEEGNERYRGRHAPPRLPSLVAGIAPAVKAVSGEAGDVLANAIKQNVVDTVAKLKSTAPSLSAPVEQGKLKIVGGIYRLRTGKVDMVA
ncbi:carbonic anhydrase [Bradyrhizobium sp. Tv2a-2]|uniref:carbonic anhydrase n=1 Tax=Bradyrhizobium sp. Tv2a-2 TaxID=113395 RepID=UPI00041DA04A|nr:carbonic anhydrase [Bradyrhizobium sp. Tv2a-2]